MADEDVTSTTQQIIVKSLPSVNVSETDQSVGVTSSPSIEMRPPSTQHIDARPNDHIAIVNAGPIGPRGPAGPAFGGHRFYGDGPPRTVIGAQPHDEYVDVLTGDIYTLL